MSGDHPVTDSRVRAWASLAARVVVGLVLGYAAVTKLGDPAATARAVRAYKLLPPGLAVPFGHALPAVELAVAVLLLIGLGLRLAGIAASLLMAMFVVGGASAAARGLKIECGCFGGGGQTTNPHYAVELVRDVLLLLLAVLVALVPQSRWSLDPATPPTGRPGEPLGGGRTAERRRRAAALSSAVAIRASNVRRRVFAVIAAGAVLAAAVLGIVVGRAGTGPLPTPAGVTAAGGVVIGTTTAPHRLVVFEDPQCPICGRFEHTSGQVIRDAVARGEISVEYRMRSFLGPESVRAVAALGAAQDEGKFEALREALFAHQPVERTGGFTVATLTALATGVGLTDPTFRAHLSAQTYAPWARRVDDQASKDGNVGTPELRLDGSVIDNTTAFSPAALAARLLRG